MTQQPQRVRVTSPRMHASRRAPARPVAHEIAEDTGLGAVVLRALVRAQLRSALALLAVVAVLLGGLPLLFALVPAARTATLAGVPVPWLLLGVGCYPALWLAARLHLRRAERHEAAFAAAADERR